MNNNEFTRNTIEAAIRLGLLVLLLVYCYNLLQPFILPVIWGIIIAVAIFPVFIKLKSLMGGKNKLASVVYTLVTLALLITPTVLVSNSIIDSASTITENYASGSIKISPPNDKVKEWPVIGEKTYALWTQASENLEGTLKKYNAETKKVVKAIISRAAGAAGTILQFIISIIISGVLLANAEGAYRFIIKLFNRLTSVNEGQEYTDLAKATIRSVAQGVLGIAVLQTVFSALGMIVMDIPAWGIWTVLVLIVAVAQLPPIIILGFVSAYSFSVDDTTPAVIFLIYNIIVSWSDVVLKPMFLGRGMATPMPIILLGAIGGMIMSGILGLFVGAIVLALSYELFVKWLDNGKESATTVS